MKQPARTFPATVTRVKDGDTFVAVADLGLRVSVTGTFRVLEYDAPETRRPASDEEIALGDEATDYANALLLGKTVICECHGHDSFGRWLVHVQLVDGVDFATAMAAEGFVKAR